MSGYKPKYFKLMELVDPDIYQMHGERCWELLRVPLLVSLDKLREHFGRLTMNDWHDGGVHKERGLRQFNSSTGAKFSQHKFGSAGDVAPETCAPQEMFAYILAHPEQFPEITVMENVATTKSWLHVDTRNHFKQGIWVVNP